MSSIGIAIMALAVAPFAVACALDALGQDVGEACGLVVLAAIGVPVGLVVWLYGMVVDHLARARDRSTDHPDG